MSLAITTKPPIKRWYWTAPYLPYSDTVSATAESRGGVTVYRGEAMRTLRFRTSDTAILLSGLSSQTAASNQEDIGVYVNGAWHMNVAFGSTDTLLHQSVSLPAGDNKLVQLVEGAQLDTSGGLDGSAVKGTYIYAIRGAIAFDPPTVPTQRIAVYGDSIVCGYYGTIPVKDGWFPQARVAYEAAGGRMSSIAWGGRAMGKEASPDTIASQLVAHVAGSTTRIIVVAIGTNDFGQSVARATFRTNYGTLLDGIRSRDTGALVYLLKPLPRLDQATPNGVAAILSDYAADIDTVRSTRTWATAVDTSAWINTATDVVGDGIHPNDTGHGKVLTQFRSLVGF